MEIVFTWFIFSLIVGAIGSGRKIGFGGAFFLSLLLSPLIGLIITLVSKNKEDEKYKKEILETQKLQQNALSKLSETGSKISIVDELEKLNNLKLNNQISEEEYQNLRNKIINL